MNPVPIHRLQRSIDGQGRQHRMSSGFGFRALLLVRGEASRRVLPAPSQVVSAWRGGRELKPAEVQALLAEPGWQVGWLAVTPSLVESSDLGF